MKKMIRFVFVLVIMMMLNSCNSVEDKPIDDQTTIVTSSNSVEEKPMDDQMTVFTSDNSAEDKPMADKAKIYYEYFNSLGEIETKPFLMRDGETIKYNVHELYYFLDDLNYDRIVDLAISSEIKDSNGIEIYTLKDGQVTPLLSNHMPYSAGSETFTLAKCDGTYGIRKLRFNSVGEFIFYQINKDGTLKTIFEGESYGIKSNPLENAADFDKIELLNFYRFDDLLKMY